MVYHSLLFPFIMLLISRSSQAIGLSRWARRSTVTIPYVFNRLSVTSDNFTGPRNISTVRAPRSAPQAVKLPHQRLFSTFTAKSNSSDISLTTQVQTWLNSHTNTPIASDVSSVAAIKQLMHLYNNDGNLPKEYVMEVLEASISMHRALPNVLQLSRRKANSTTGEPNNELFTGRLTIVGDTHGQYEDFAQIFEIAELGDYPTEDNQFVINGDMVDRGPKAVEIVMVLLFAKLLCPNSVHILRGNHETASMSENFGFQKEVLRKYDRSVWNKFTEFFDTLPVAAVIENSAFVVHGGIGPQTVHMSVEDINKVDRFEEPAYDGPINEMLWSDPKDKLGGFRANKARGGGTVQFGANVTQNFLAHNNLHYIVRSHEVEMQGFRSLHEGLCITVFSAPNYCGDVGNLGAVIRYDQPTSSQPTVVQFAPASFVKAQQAEKQQQEKDQDRRIQQQFRTGIPLQFPISRLQRRGFLHSTSNSTSGKLSRAVLWLAMFSVLPTLSFVAVSCPLAGGHTACHTIAVSMQSSPKKRSKHPPVERTPFVDNSVQKEIHDWLFRRKSKVAVASSRKALKKLMSACSKFGTDKLPPKELLLNLLDVSTKEHQLMPNVLQIDRTMVNGKFTGKLIIVGDTHGQYHDFAHIFKTKMIGGYPAENNQFVINGDIVDRGPKAVEILIVLLFAKLLCPNSVHILRGNHETKGCTQVHGFKAEVLRKYDAEVYEKFLEFFKALPIAAVVEKSVFVVHGGIGFHSAAATMEEINQANRADWKKDPCCIGGTEQKKGLIEEMLWADPSEDKPGLQRGMRGTTFGVDATKAFLAKHNLQCLVRSHQLQQEGYKVMHDGKCISVFSAPNYCGQWGNKGAVVRYVKPDSMKPEVVQYTARNFLFK